MVRAADIALAMLSDASALDLFSPFVLLVFCRILLGLRVTGLESYCMVHLVMYHIVQKGLFRYWFPDRFFVTFWARTEGRISLLFIPSSAEVPGFSFLR